MSHRSLAGMSEVLRLTRTGRLQDATSAIQRMLGGQPSTPAAAESVKHTATAPSTKAVRVIQGEPFRGKSRRPLPDRTRGATGELITGLYTNEAGTRSYTLYIPSGYRGQSLPLIVMLHGCTQDPDDFATGTRMNHVAEERQCFVLYPAQATSANRSKCWNWFKAGHQLRAQGEPSIVAGITHRIMTSHSIDPRRVYVAGLSAGGAMAVTMGMTYPELYAAVGVHSGIAHAVAHDLPSAFAVMRGDDVANGGRRTIRERVVPTIVFHGDRDTTVHPVNAERVIAQSLRVPGNGDARTGMGSHVSVERGQAANGHAYTRTIYHDARGEPSVEHWLVHGAGHAWSGGSPNGSFTDSKGPDASKEMVRFFGERSQSATRSEPRD